MNLFNPAKVVKGSLVGIDGNAFVMMGYFSSLAKRQGWKKDEIKKVTDECMSRDYDHLITTLLSHMED